MKQSRLLTFYTWAIAVIFVGMVLHAPIAVYMGSLLPAHADGIKAWKELLLVMLSLVAVVLITRRKAWPLVAKDWLLRLSVAYIALHGVLAVTISQEILPIIAGLMIDLRFIVFFMLVYVLALLYPNTQQLLKRVTAIAAAVVVGFGLLQITVLPDDILANIGYNSETIRPFTTIDRNTDFIRINSTLRGPNPLGAVCVIYLALVAAFAISRRRIASTRLKVGLLVLFAATAAVLVASFSRSAFVAAAVAVVIVGLSAWRRPSVVSGLIGTGVLLVLSVAAIGLQQTDWYSNVILHEDPGSTVVKKSNDEHIRSLENGAQRVLNEPLGAGIGSTGSASLYGSTDGPTIENYYLFVAHESGWLGLGLFIALFGGILYQLWQRRSQWMSLALFSSGVGLALIGVLLPVWADETVALVWWGLAGGILGGGYAARTRQQKTA